MKRGDVLEIIASHRVLGVPRVDLALYDGLKPAIRERTLKETVPVL